MFDKNQTDVIKFGLAASWANKYCPLATIMEILPKLGITEKEFLIARDQVDFIINAESI